MAFVAGVFMLPWIYVLRRDAARWRRGESVLPQSWRRLGPFLGLLLLVTVAISANAQALTWSGEVQPLAQYRAYCQTYGARDPGCAGELGGGRAAAVGPDRLDEDRPSLSMAVHIHRQVVADLTYVEEAEDVWQVLGTLGTGMQGDCDDVVMTTISRLLRRGYPRGALRATLVELPDGQGHHLILGVRLPDGETFLDDRHRWPRTAAELELAGYRFVAQEVPGEAYWLRARRPDQVADRDAGAPQAPATLLR